MPKFLKDSTIALLDSGVESYLLGLYGMAVPTVRTPRKGLTRYAPIIGLYGASAELLVKACLVQAKDKASLYKDGDVTAGVYSYGSETLSGLRRLLMDDEPCVAFIWEDIENHAEQKAELLHCLGQFKLLQALRADGLHAGLGCSRDIAVSVATDIYTFIQLISRGKKLRPYLKNIPGPEPTIRDREAIIEDLNRRFRNTKDATSKVECLRNMYLVLPYIPDIKPDWIDMFDQISVSSPGKDDFTYLTKTLLDAHSIFLLKNRGGKNGIPVRVDPENPEALPIAIQNIKRTLNTIPDKFNNDVLTANTRLEEGRLDLPLEDFIIDLYALGINETNILSTEGQKLTAQQAWPFVAAAYSTNGTPRPCWFIIKACDELDQLIAYMKRAEKIGNGYLRRRMPEILAALHAIKKGSSISFAGARDYVFKEISPYRDKCHKLAADEKNPFTIEFLSKFPAGEKTNSIIREYVAGEKSAGDTLATLLEMDTLSENDKKYALTLLPLCFDDNGKSGLVSVLRTNNLKSYSSMARKMMFFTDFLSDGPQVQ